jgi:hypothetical protein
MAFNTRYLYWGVKPLYMTEARKTALILPITAAYGTRLGINDPVMGVTAGTLERAATTGGSWLGTILELFRIPVTTTRLYDHRALTPVQYVPATDATYSYLALVTTDHHMFYSMQEDGLTSSLTIAGMFAAADLVFPTDCDTVTGQSAAMIDSNTFDATTTRPLQIIAPLSNYYDIDAGQYTAITAATNTALQYGKFIVRNANSQFNNLAVSLAFA